MKYSLSASAAAFLFPLFLLAACGGGGDSANPSTPVATKTSPPQKIGFNLPSTLVTSSSVNRSANFAAKQVKANKSAAQESVPGLPSSPQILQTKSYAFDEFKITLSDANWRRLNTNVSLLYLDSIWSQIEQNCASVPVDTACTIGANTVVR